MKIIIRHGVYDIFLPLNLPERESNLSKEWTFSSTGIVVDPENTSFGNTVNI